MRQQLLKLALLGSAWVCRAVAFAWASTSFLVVSAGVRLTVTYQPWWWPAGLALFVFSALATLPGVMRLSRTLLLSIPLLMLLAHGLWGPLQALSIAVQYQCAIPDETPTAPTDLPPNFVFIDASADPWTSTATCFAVDPRNGAIGAQCSTPLYSVTRGAVRPKAF